MSDTNRKFMSFGETIVDKIVASTILAALIGVAVFCSYLAFAYVLAPVGDAMTKKFYADCVRRGGTINEGPWGRACVGVRIPPTN